MKQTTKNASCLYLCKDTNFLANHNTHVFESVKKALFIPVQRYEFFS